APEFWSQRGSEIFPPLAALLSPTVFVLYREWVARQTIMVTDGAIVVVDAHDEPLRLAHGGIAAISRDWLRGGVQIRGSGVSVFIPSHLVDPTRAALASRLRG